MVENIRSRDLARLVERVAESLKEPQHRFELHDPFAETTFRFPTAKAAKAKADEMGATRFQHCDAGGTVRQVDKVDGEWWARSEQTPPQDSQRPPGAADKPLASVQEEIDRSALRDIEARAALRLKLGQALDADTGLQMATADAHAFRRIESEGWQESAAVEMALNAYEDPGYMAGLRDALPGYPGTADRVYALDLAHEWKCAAKGGRKTTEFASMTADRAREDNSLEQAGASQSGSGEDNGVPVLEIPAGSGVPGRPAVRGVDLSLTLSLLQRFDKHGADFFFRGTDQKSFTVHDGRITTRLHDRETIAGMLSCAESKGWSSVAVKGSGQFRRAAWYEAKQRGLAVAGYEPTREEAALFPARSDLGLPAECTRQALNSIEAMSHAAGGGADAKPPLPPEAECAGVVGPTRTEASLDEARKQIADALGEKASVFRAETRGGTYRGEVIAETQLHVVQRISSRMAVIHNRVDVAGGIIGQRGVYAYKGGRAQFAANREQQLMKAGLER